MDAKSKTFLCTHQGPLEPTQHQMNIPGQRATLKVGDKNANNNIHHHVRLHYYEHKLEQCFRHHTSIPENLQKLIQWWAFEWTFRKAPAKDRVSIFKLIHEKWPTNMVQAKWDWEKDPMCQRWSDREQTFQHIFSAPARTPVRLFEKNLLLLKMIWEKLTQRPLSYRCLKICFWASAKATQHLWKRISINPMKWMS